MSWKEKMKRLFICVMVFLLALSIAEADIPLANRSTLHGDYDPGVPVSDEAVNAILRAAFAMPTGGNQRALEFFVVTDRETMQGMKGGNPWSQALDTAPCVIVISGDMDSAYYEELLEMDAGIAAGAMLIQAADMGLTTCVLSIAPQETRIQSVRDALETDNVPILMVAIGYPAADAVTGASVDGWDDGQIHWQ